MAELSAPEVELAFLGSALMCGDAGIRADVRRIVGPDCFTRPIHKAAWPLVCEAWDRGEMADVVSVGKATGIDGAVEHLMRPLGGVDSWEGHMLPRGRLLRKLARKRALIQAGTEAVQDAMQDEDIDGALVYHMRLAEMLDALDAQDETGEVAPVMDEIERLAEEGEAPGIPVGLTAFDSWAGGLRIGGTHIFGGPTGSGKTWWLAYIAAQLVAERKVAFFTLEMSPRELIGERILPCMVGMKAFRFQTPGRTWLEDEWREYQDARAVLTSGNLRLYSRSRSFGEIAAHIRATEPDVALVDYVQLMSWPDGARDEYPALTWNMDHLQALGQRTGCAMVLATQMSRKYLSGRHTGIMGGRGSGRVDEAANLWVKVESGEDNGEYKLTCAKNRHGPTGGEVRYALDAATGRMVERR